MKKSKTITLVLITSALASCHKEQQRGASGSWDEKKVYMRSDTTASYTRTHYHHTGVAGALLWYYAFRPYGRYSGGRYDHAGYYSGGLGHGANVGTNSTKNAITRGGFGRGGSSVS